MNPYSFDTAGLERCLIMVFAGATNLAELIEANVRAIEASTRGPLGVIALVDLPDEGTRVSLFRDGTRKDAAGVAPDLDIGDASVVQTFFTRALVSLPRGCKSAAGFRGHGTGTVVLADHVVRSLRSGRAPLVKAWLEGMLRVLRDQAPELWELVRASLVTPFFAPTNSNTGSRLTIFETRSALEGAFRAAGRQCEFLFLDTCHNATLEFWVELSGVTDRLVASELSEEKDGWPYGAWLQAIGPGSTTSEVIGAALRAFDDARTNDGSLSPYTLGSFGDVQPVMQAFKALARALLDSGEGVANVREVVKAQAPVLSGGLYDLHELASRLAELTGDAAVKSAAQAVIGALTAARSGFVPGSKTRFHGISVFLPVAGGSFTAAFQSDFVKLEICKQSVWFDFLKKLVTPPFS